MKEVIESNEQYHSSDAISASGLKFIAKKSVHHFLNKHYQESPAMKFGTAVHTAMLESDKFYDDYYIMPKVDGRTKEGKAAKALHEQKAKGKIVLDEADHIRIKEIMKNLEANEIAKKYCTGEIEVSHYGQMNGVDVRVRPDCKNQIAGWVSDVKTCQDNSPDKFKSDIYKFKYHIQAAFYCDALGMNPADFRFIAVEVNHPYSIEIYGLSESMIEKGRYEYQKALESWKLYKDTGVALGYESENRNDDGSIIL